MTATHTRNILKVYRAASPEQIDAGMSWYSEAYDLAVSLTPNDVWMGAGILSAYSPLTPWWRNVELATSTITTGVVRTDTLPNNYRAAGRILAGEPTLDVLKGTKTRHFAEAIATNGDTDKVTVDSIAYSVAAGSHFAAKSIKGFGKGVYTDIALSYSRAAKREDLSPCQMQAITWVVWRDMHPNKSANKAS